MINRFARLVMLIGSLSGCAAVNHPVNSTKAVENTEPDQYSFSEIVGKEDNQVTVVLAFSGGGTRAAALSYGVLKQLNETMIDVNGEQRSLLSEVDVISSVSGGSFTAAYYGLYQEKIFTDYEQSFLYYDVKDELLSMAFSPSRWFSTLGRTDTADRFYQENLFGDATFSDIDTETSPYIIINASDITTGVRFSFIQEYFDLICSDVGEYPVSKAVAASAAVPVLFEPVVLENHRGCEDPEEYIANYVEKDRLSFQSLKTLESIREYSDKEKNQYIHLVDGGITDNLGLLAIYDLLEFGNFHVQARKGYQDTHHVIIISVDASTEPELGIGQSVDFPSVSQTLNSITDIQLHRYNDATKALFTKSMSNWAQEASTDELTVIPHFIEVAFTNTVNDEKRFLFNQVPTDLTLDNQIVTELINEGGRQLGESEELNQILLDVNQAQTSSD